MQSELKPVLLKVHKIASHRLLGQIPVRRDAMHKLNMVRKFASQQRK